LVFLVFPVGEPSLGEKKVNPISSSWGNPLGEVGKNRNLGFSWFFWINRGGTLTRRKKAFCIGNFAGEPPRANPFRKYLVKWGSGWGLNKGPKRGGKTGLK
jgi:hypothetical protein